MKTLDLLRKFVKYNPIFPLVGYVKDQYPEKLVVTNSNDCTAVINISEIIEILEFKDYKNDSCRECSSCIFKYCCTSIKY